VAYRAIAAMPQTAEIARLEALPISEAMIERVALAFVDAYWYRNAWDTFGDCMRDEITRCIRHAFIAALGGN